MNTKIYGAPYKVDNDLNTYGDFDKLLLRRSRNESDGSISSKWTLRCRHTSQEAPLSPDMLRVVLENYFLQTAIEE